MSRALARRAVACPGWRWLPGMRAMVYAEGYGPVPASPERLDDLEAEAYEAGGLGEQWPDLTDPATLGCLLALVREAFGCPHLSAVYDSDSQGWGIWIDYADDDDPWVGLGGHYSPTEAEALVVALEAAP